MMINTNNH